TAVALLFVFNVPAPTAIYTLSLHDALPIFLAPRLEADPAERVVLRDDPGRDARQAQEYGRDDARAVLAGVAVEHHRAWRRGNSRSEEHTSELQSPYDLVCRLLLEKKKNKKI